MNIKNVTAKATSVGASVLLFATLWAWIAHAGGGGEQPGEDGGSFASSDRASDTIIHRIIVVRRGGGDAISSQAPADAQPQPVARSRGS